MREITNVYSGRSDEVLILCVDGKTKNASETTKVADNVTLVRCKARNRPYYNTIGYWTGLAYNLAEIAADYAAEHGKPDIIETADGFGIGYFAIQRKLCLDPLFKDVPIVTVAHTPTYMIDHLDGRNIYELPIYWHRTMEQFGLSGADHIVSPSQALLTKLEKDIPGQLPAATVIRNPFESEHSLPKKSDFSSEVKRDHFFVASRLCYWKGVSHITAIFDRIWTEGLSDAKLVLYGGDTKYRAVNLKMSAFLKKKYPQHIESGLLEIAGKKPRDVINERSKSAYAQIHPSLFDNFPYSVLESLDSGVITLINNAGGHNEILEDGKSAFVFDIQNPDTCIKAILKAANLSDKERFEMAKKGHQVVKSECSYDAFYSEKKKLFQRLIKERSASKRFPFARCNPKPIPKSLMSGQRDLLSVVIPYFNMQDFIDETIASIMGSDYPNIEVVLVDDGSTQQEAKDKLLEIEAADYTHPIRIIRTENQGVARARNTGAAQAKGQFLALLDADDIVTASYYSRTVSILSQYNNVAFAGSWNEDFKDEDGSKIREWPTFNTEPPMQAIFNSTNCQGLVYWRDVFLKSGQHDPDLNMFLDDWESTISLLADGFHGVMIPEALFRYRIRDESIFRSKADLWSLNYAKITQKHAGLYNEWGAEITAFMNANGRNTNYHIPGFEPSSSASSLHRRAIEGEFLDVMEFMANFMENSRIGRFIRTSTWLKNILEWIMRKL